jgi:Protein of unknown function (DUF4236)
MGFRFRRSLGLLPGVRINLSRSGPSLSLGPRGFHYTIGPRGTRVTAGLPGSGLSWTQYTPYSSHHSSKGSGNRPLGDDARSRDDESSLPVIQSAAAERIAQLSTSELAPILNSAQRRFPFAPAVTTVCLIAGIFTFLSNDEVLLGAAVLFTAVFVPVAIYLDRYRRSVRIEYLLDDITGKIANALSETFGDLKGCGRVWSIRAQGATAIGNATLVQTRS